MGSGKVYVVHNDWIQNPNAKSGYKTYKIGITTESVKKRFSGLASKMPNLGLKMPSEFVCDFAYEFGNEQYKEVEQTLHQILNPSWQGGEWFDLNNEALKGVHKVCQQNGGRLITDEVTQTIDEEAKEEGGKSPRKSSGQKSLQKEFWTYVVNYLEQHSSFLRLRKPVNGNRYTVSIGRLHFKILLGFDGEPDNQVWCGLCIEGKAYAKKGFFKLKEEKEIIEKEIDTELCWDDDDLEKYNHTYISVYRKGTIKDREQWEDIAKWLMEYSEKFYKTFSDRVKNLEL